MIKAELNETETKNQQKRSMKLRPGSLKRYTKVINLQLDLLRKNENYLTQFWKFKPQQSEKKKK